MADNFRFDEFESKELNNEQKSALIKNIDTSNKSEEEKKTKNKINFQPMPKEEKEVFGEEEKGKIINQITQDLTKEQSIPMPYDQGQTSHLSLILSPNLKELELMIRGLEYVRRSNPITGKEEIYLRKIPDHPLNEYGINTIMAELKVYSSPEIKLGRKRVKDYYNSVQHVGHSIVRLIYKNLRNFGMDTQVKQRNAKRFCNAIVEFVDASYSRSVEGRENDSSRPTEFSVQGNVDAMNDPTKFIYPKQKENLKN